jgi:hypothetical protein
MLDSGLTKFLAVWGAILSSITFGWTLYRDLRDRAKVKIKAELRQIGQLENGKPFTAAPDLEVPGTIANLFVVVSVVNVGRRPMRWRGLAGTYRHPRNGKNGFVVQTMHLPRTLQEQEQHDELIAMEEPFRNELIQGGIKHLCILDVAGRKWNVSRADMKQLVADAKKHTTASDN